MFGQRIAPGERFDIKERNITLTWSEALVLGRYVHDETRRETAREIISLMMHSDITFEELMKRFGVEAGELQLDSEGRK